MHLQRNQRHFCKCFSKRNSNPTGRRRFWQLLPNCPCLHWQVPNWLDQYKYKVKSVENYYSIVKKFSVIYFQDLNGILMASTSFPAHVLHESFIYFNVNILLNIYYNYSCLRIDPAIPLHPTSQIVRIEGTDIAVTALWTVTVWPHARLFWPSPAQRQLMLHHCKFH